MAESKLVESGRSPLRVMVTLGTRPEAIKLAPVVHELERRPEVQCQVCATGQHDQLLDQGLAAFGLKADLNLNVMEHGQTLGMLTSRLFNAVEQALDEVQPDWMVVQGDTTTAFVAAMAAHYRGIRIGHVEAGLRTGNRWAPFPEETNRRVVGLVADLHFAPTERAAANLRREGVPDHTIIVTGNTIVDALLLALEGLGGQAPPWLPPDVTAMVEHRRLVLVTGHRRESFGPGLESICLALRDLADQFDDVSIIYPVHLNPEVQQPARRLLRDHLRIALLDPLDYLSMVWLMSRAHLILTDSGGIQEEAPTLGTPVLVLRDTTERPELLEAGCGRLVGNKRTDIVAAASELLGSDAAHEAMRPRLNPFGDGRAAVRIVDTLLSPP